MVGEDLGTVESGVRAELRRRGLLSYRLAWFESKPPERYPSSGARRTDNPRPADQPPGVWTGADLVEMECDRPSGQPRAELGVRRRLQRLTGAADGDPASLVVERAYAALARAPSRLIVATLDDACLAERRPNLPGDPVRPNWSIPLPRTLEQLRRDPAPAADRGGAQRPRLTSRRSGLGADLSGGH